MRHQFPLCQYKKKLKNLVGNYILKKYFFKKLLKWANKKQNNFNIYNVAFFKKNKEKHTCVPKILMIWSTVPDI